MAGFDVKAQVRRGQQRLASSFTALLVATAIGVYTLVIVGATFSATEGAQACTTWPTCDGRWLVPIGESTLLLAMGHRMLSLVVGVALLLTTVAAWTSDATEPTKWILTLLAGVYPLQVGIGALTALSAGVNPYPMLHLLVAMGIFVGVLLALVWWLEVETAEIVSTFGDNDDRKAAIDPSGAGPTSTPGVAGTIKAYLELTKPRLMWLLCFVALAGIGLATAATGDSVSGEVVIGTLLGGILAIGASGTFNHLLERDVDQKMQRTAERPTVTDQVSVQRATIFGIALGLASMIVFLTMVNPLAAALGLLAILFYSVVYTIVLKPNTTQNIVIGGAVGAIPALIGWAAITGSIGLPAIVLGALIFLWTPAHFYNLALAYKQDYARGGFPMLPVARGERVTLRHIAWYFGATLLAAVALGLVAPLGIIYAVTVVAFAAVFLGAIVQLFRARTPKVAMRSFHASNAFLGTMMLIIILETLLLSWIV